MLIKDFAVQEGVSTQAIYKLLKTHAEALEGHVIKGKKSTDLDSFAQAYLQSHMVGNQVVNLDRAQADEIDRLRGELRKLQDELIVKNQILIEAQNQILQIEQMTDDRVKAAEAAAKEPLQSELEEQLRIRGEQDVTIGNLRQEIDQKDQDLSTLQEQLEQERSRRLSFGEAVRRVFKKEI